ncbi:MAG: complex I subunit 5 family protein, partial [Nitrospirales bacterium]
MREQLPALTFVCPLLVGIAMPLIGLAKRAWCRPATIGALGVMSVLAVASYVAVLSGGEVRYAFSGWAAPIGIEWIADGLSSLLLVVLALLALTAVVYGGPLTPQGLGNRIVPYYTLIMLLMTGLTGVVMSGDLFNIFVFLEVASLSSYGLVAVAGGPALLAAFRYLILGTIGASFYLLGVAYFYAVTGTLNMDDLAHRLPELLESKAVIAGLIFMMIGLGIKMALVPLHGWLPDAYTHAPDGVTSLIAPLVTKVAMFAVIRIMFWVLGTNTVIYHIPVLMIVGWIAAMATIVGAFLALNQQDVKRLFT